MLLAPKPAKEDKIDNIEQKLLHISGVPRLLAHPVVLEMNYTFQVLKCSVIVLIALVGTGYC